MKLSGIESVSVSKKTFIITNFNEFTSFYKNLKIKDGKLSKCLYKRQIGDIGYNLTVKNVYELDGKTYFVTGDRVYLFNGTGVQRLTFYSGETAGIFSVIYAGVKRTLMLNKGGSQFLDGDKKAVQIPFKKHAEVVGDKMFLGEGSALIYGYTTDLSGFSELGKQIILPTDAGEIIALIKDGKELLIFCSLAVFRLTTFGEGVDFKLDRLNLPRLNLLEGTVVSLGDRVAFIDGNKLCTLKGDSINSVDTALSIDRLDVIKECVSFKGKYVLPFEYGGEKFAYIIDVKGGDEQVLSIPSAIGEEGTYVVNDKIYRIDQIEGEPCGSALYESVCTDFCSPKNKALTNVYVDCDQSAELKLSSAYFDKKFDISASTRPKKCNLSARKFAFSLSADIPFNAQKIIFEYRIKGE
ncbi:MAG: hypothetical protein IJC07_04120 [Clostridia bacterium]|nr:hypothetical protein [Clostridia bacterium]